MVVKSVGKSIVALLGYWTRPTRLLCHSSQQSFESLSSNIQWKTYVTPYSNQVFYVAEAANIDPVFEQAIEQNLPEPFGIVTWDSSLIAIEILDEMYSARTETFSGKTVCDLGCGTGLIGLICASWNASIIALDFSNISLSLARMSYARNQQKITCEKRRLSGNIAHLEFDIESAQPLPPCDLLILSDILYYEKLALSAARRVHEAMDRFKCQILVTDPGRVHALTFESELHRLLNNNASYSTRQQSKLRPRISFTMRAKGKGQYIWINNSKG